MSDKHETFIDGYDIITKPHHYNWHPSGVECKEICDDLPRWIGDALSYIWRRNHKGQPLDDRRKALERLGEWSTRRYVALAHIGVGGEWFEKCREIFRVGYDSDTTLSLAVSLVAGAHRAKPMEELLQAHRYLVRALEDEIEELEKEGK